MTKYKITIAHPTGGTVTLRTSAGVISGNDSGKFLRTGDVVVGFIDFRDNGDAWVEITEGLNVGLFFAVKYGVKVFGQWTPIEVTPPPPPTEIFPDYFVLESPTGQRQRYNKNA